METDKSTHYQADWAQKVSRGKWAHAVCSRVISISRKFNLIEHQNDLLQATLPPDSEEYFIACHDHAHQLMLKKEFERALLVLDEVHDFIRKTDRISQLGDNLILQATIHLVNHDMISVYMY